MTRTVLPTRMPTRMLAAELIRPGSMEMRESAVPSPGPGELVVRVEAALTCGTDLKTFQRGHPKIPLPAPMGHEFSGTVAAVGRGVTAFIEGDAIACVPTAPCGECRLCRRGRDNLCPQASGRIVLGAFAEYVRLPAHIVATHTFLRPATMTPEVAAALEPLSCVARGVRRVRLEEAETVVLLGDGPIALLFLQLVRRAAPGRVLVVGRHAVRLAVARTLGADGVIDAAVEPVDEAVRDWTGGGADLVIECVGRPEAWEQAVALTATAGTALLFGGCAADTTVRLPTYRVHYEEVEITGAFHYGRADVAHAFELLALGAVHVEPLITHHRPLSRLMEALDLVLDRRGVKVAVRPDALGDLDTGEDASPARAVEDDASDAARSPGSDPASADA